MLGQLTRHRTIKAMQEGDLAGAVTRFRQWCLGVCVLVSGTASSLTLIQASQAIILPTLVACAVLALYGCMWGQLVLSVCKENYHVAGHANAILRLGFVTKLHIQQGLASASSSAPIQRTLWVWGHTHWHNEQVTLYLSSAGPLVVCETNKKLVAVWPAKELSTHPHPVSVKHSWWGAVVQPAKATTENQRHFTSPK